MDFQRLASGLACAILIASPSRVVAVENATPLTLTALGVDVSLAVSKQLGEKRSQPNSSFIVIHVLYPDGAVLVEPLLLSRNVVKVFIRAVGPNMRTRTEGKVAEALPLRPASPGGRYWFETTRPDGVQVYKYRFKTGTEQELHVFKGQDDALVGIEMAIPSVLVHEGSRRYKKSLEILFLYSRDLQVGVQEMDNFLIDFLDANILGVRTGR